jgi:hypothetical protein
MGVLERFFTARTVLCLQIARVRVASKIIGKGISLLAKACKFQSPLGNEFVLILWRDLI